jgi:hypothetical protein
LPIVANQVGWRVPDERMPPRASYPPSNDGGDPAIFGWRPSDEVRQTAEQ